MVCEEARRERLVRVSRSVLLVELLVANKKRAYVCDALLESALPCVQLSVRVGFPCACAAHNFCERDARAAYSAETVEKGRARALLFPDAVRNQSALNDN